MTSVGDTSPGDTLGLGGTSVGDLVGVADRVVAMAEGGEELEAYT